jgi:FAD:protein FMN transferase
VKPPKTSVNRRELLRLRSAGPRSRSALPQKDPISESRRGDLGFDIIKAARPAMGSYFEIRLPAVVPGAVELATRALDRIEALEEQLTVYSDDSELSRLNARAHGGPIEVEAGLFALLEQAVAIGEATGGAYDVTAGALSIAWGFFKGPKRVPDPATLAEARARTGQQHLTLDSARRTVAFDRPGVVINLGSIGKGYAIDQAVDLIKTHWWPTSALLHGGQSSLYALGSPPGRFGGRWPIALRNPFDPSAPLGTLRVRNRGVGTSGASVQQFEVAGRVYGHILDPRTGEPAQGPASVTVLAPSAADADALSTAFYLLGPDATAAYIDRHPGIGAIFITEGPADRSPRIQALGLTDDDFDRVF